MKQVTITFASVDSHGECVDTTLQLPMSRECTSSLQEGNIPSALETLLNASAELQGYSEALLNGIKVEVAD